MRLHWENAVDVSVPVEQVYAYLSDFSRHAEWSRTLERMELIHVGDATGVGARYMTHERVAFPVDSTPARSAVMRTVCEVRELVPNRRIAWHAHPLPRVGSAELCFELATTATGGTRITQTIREYYPWPVALLIRLRHNVTEDGIRRQLDRGLLTLKDTIESRLGGHGQDTPQAA